MDTLERIILFETIRDDEVAARLAELLHDTTTDSNLIKATREAFYSTQRVLLNNLGSGKISGNYLQDHICRLIAESENVFSRMSEDGVFKDLDSGISAADLKKTLTPEAETVILLAANEISLISEVYRFDFEIFHKVTDDYDIAAVPVSNASKLSNRELIHKALTRDDSLAAAVTLSDFYHSYGSGVFQAASALTAEDSGLVPVPNIDDISVHDLIGYESQKRMLSDNLEILLSGLPANNMLLYGDSGTGKSSTVKALLNKYASNGLKMISVAKNKLDLLPGILEQIANRGMKFIIFIDDLSFEENEHEYKAFKSIIEGRVAPRPRNAVFIVTSNRKNIVKEVWRDREDQDDVRRRDNIQEKRSLADRFGITLVFSAPDKTEYLEIVRGIAKKSGLSMPDEELVNEALKWEIRHGGRSGRAARQFVDYMVGIKR